MTNYHRGNLRLHQSQSVRSTASRSPIKVGGSHLLGYSPCRAAAQLAGFRIFDMHEIHPATQQQLDNGTEHDLSDVQKSRLEGILTAEQRVHKAPELQMKRGMRSSRTGNYQFVRLLFEGTVPPPATQKFPWILNPQNQPWGRRQCGKLREPTATTVPIPPWRQRFRFFILFVFLVVSCFLQVTHETSSSSFSLLPIVFYG